MAVGDPSLSGVRIVVARPRHQSRELVTSLRRLGATTRCIPAVRIVKPDSWTSFDRAVQVHGHYDWVIFTSQNGVRHVTQRLMTLNKSWSFAAKTAAVGVETARCLEASGCHVDLIPHISKGAAIAEAIAASESNLLQSRILLLRGQLADSNLGLTLQQMGAIVQECIVYQTFPEPSAAPRLLKLIDNRQVDWLTITSGSAIQSFTRLPDAATSLHRIHLASIGPQTSRAIQEAGLRVSAEAEKPNINALVCALVNAQMALQ